MAFSRALFYAQLSKIYFTLNSLLLKIASLANKANSSLWYLTVEKIQIFEEKLR